MRFNHRKIRIIGEEIFYDGEKVAKIEENAFETTKDRFIKTLNHNLFERYHECDTCPHTT